MRSLEPIDTKSPLNLEIDHTLGFDELPGLGDHGHQDPHGAAIGGCEQGTHLRAKESGAV